MNSELKIVDDSAPQADNAASAPESVPRQTEMPFAVIEGEPLTELPKDLYIPPDALQVFLEAFEGPLDLLLYFIRRQNIDILDIPIAEITKQYMQYIDVMQELQLELAGEYLLMAAMLAEIKSRMLLPRVKSEDGTEEEDPRAELVRRLQEYERFKKAADDMDHLKRMDRDTLPAAAELVERKIIRVPPQVSLEEMLLAFRDVVRRSEMFAHHHVRRERLSVRQRMAEVLDRLNNAEFIEFTALFAPEEGRMGVTVTFSAILELMKEGMLDIVQAEPYAPIHVRRARSRQEQEAEIQIATLATDAENEAALSQPELEGENEDFEEAPAASEAEAEAAPDELTERTDEPVAEEAVSDAEPVTAENNGNTDE